mmetsp:Transcript_39151/g.91217  ORF Transcript_39151/g.91217 Transcript_39151/m.91217 type:complete len:218 (-) Transcript_39151:363-1016(-)
MPRILSRNNYSRHSRKIKCAKKCSGRSPIQFVPESDSNISPTSSFGFLEYLRNITPSDGSSSSPTIYKSFGAFENISTQHEAIVSPSLSCCHGMNKNVTMSKERTHSFIPSLSSSICSSLESSPITSNVHESVILTDTHEKKLRSNRIFVPVEGSYGEQSFCHKTKFAPREKNLISRVRSSPAKDEDWGQFVDTVDAGGKKEMYQRRRRFLLSRRST